MATVNVNVDLNRSVVRNQAYCSARVGNIPVLVRVIYLCDWIIDYLSIISTWSAELKFDKPSCVL